MRASYLSVGIPPSGPDDSPPVRSTSFPSEFDSLVPTTVLLSVPLLFGWNLTPPISKAALAAVSPVRHSRRGGVDLAPYHTVGFIRVSLSLSQLSSCCGTVTTFVYCSCTASRATLFDGDTHLPVIDADPDGDTQLPVFGADFTETWNEQCVNASSSVFG